MRDVYVISSCRTAVGKFGGSLKDVPAAELGATVIAEALKRGNVKGEWLDEVMFGNVLSAAQGQNVARQCMVKAGVPLKVPAYTVSMVCGSGLKSVIEGSRAIQAGDADLIMCGGTENMSAAPYAIPEARWGARMGEKKLIDTMIKDGLWDAYNNYHMGTTAENICDIWGITREELDEFGYNSQQKAVAAVKSGRFKDEIVPVTVKQKKKEFVFDTDEDPRDTTLEKLGSLKGAFAVSDDNTVDKVDMTFEATHMTPSADNIGVKRVTAGNASGINDGAAAIILASKDAVEKYGLKPLFKVISWGQGGVDPKIMGTGPIPGTGLRLGVLRGRGAAGLENHSHAGKGRDILPGGQALGRFQGRFIIALDQSLHNGILGGKIIIDAPLPDPRSLSNIADGDGLYAALPQQLLERV